LTDPLFIQSIFKMSFDGFDGAVTIPDGKLFQIFTLFCN